MKSLEVGEDIYPFVVVEDVFAIRANLQARLSIVRGEYPADVGLGIPLGASQDEIDLYVRKIILNTFGVRSISEFSSTMAGKRYSCKFKAETVFGSLYYA